MHPSSCPYSAYNFAFISEDQTTLPLNQELTTTKLKRRYVLKEKNAKGYLSDL